MTEEEIRKEEEDRIIISVNFSTYIINMVSKAKEENRTINDIKGNIEQKVHEILDEKYKTAEVEITAVFTHFANLNQKQKLLMEKIKNNAIEMFPGIKIRQVHALVKALENFLNPSTVNFDAGMEKHKELTKVACSDHLWMAEILKRRVGHVIMAFSNLQLKVIHWQINIPVY